MVVRKRERRVNSGSEGGVRLMGIDGVWVVVGGPGGRGVKVVSGII